MKNKIRPTLYIDKELMERVKECAKIAFPGFDRKANEFIVMAVMEKCDRVEQEQKSTQV